jgi:YD repeat-containing protein
MTSKIAACIITLCLGLAEKAGSAGLDSLVVAREEWTGGVICENEYSNAGSLIQKTCDDSSGKEVKNIFYDYSGGRRTSEKCTSKIDDGNYTSSLEYDEAGNLSKITTTYENPSRIVISTVKTSPGGNILEEVQKYPSGTFVDSARYFYSNGRLDTVKHYSDRGTSNKRNIHYYDTHDRLERIDYWIGTTLSFINTQEFFYYKPLRDPVTSARMIKEAVSRRSGQQKAYRTNGKVVTEKEKASTPAFRHD